jgi:hypothetical protein
VAQKERQSLMDARRPAPSARPILRCLSEMRTAQAPAAPARRELEGRLLLHDLARESDQVPSALPARNFVASPGD